MDTRFSQWVVNHPWLVIAATVLLFFCASSGMQKLIVDMEPSHNIVEDNPARVAFDNFEATFGESDDIILVVENTQGSLLTPEHLNIIQQLTEQAWQTPYSTRVDSLTNFQFSVGNGDTLEVSDLVEDALALSTDKLQRVIEVAQTDERLLYRHISPDGRLSAIYILVSVPEDHLVPQQEAASYIKDVARELESQHPELRTYLNGLIISNQANVDVTMQDMSVIIPGMYLVIMILLALLLRSILALAITMAVTLFSACSAFGTAAWLGIPVHQFSLSSINVIIAIAIANAVHVLLFFLMRYQQPDQKKATIEQSLKINFQPVILTSLTTALGFLSMNLSELPPSQTLGNLVAIGVVYAFIYSMFLLPAVVVVVPIKVHSQVQNLSLFMARFGEWVIRYRNPVFWCCLIACLTLLAFLPRNVFNEHFSKFIDESHEFRHDQDYIDQHFGGIARLNIILDSGQPGGISDPQYLTHLDAMTQWLRSQPEVINVISYSDTIKRLNRSMHAEDETFHTIPDSQELAAQYLLLYQLSLPFGHNMDRTITPDQSTTRVQVNFPSMSSIEANEFTARIKAWQMDNLPAVMIQDSTSMMTLFVHIGEASMKTAIQGALWALLLISLVLMFALRSLKFGLISLIPNLLPAGVGFGIWALVNGEMGMTLGAVLGITIGIVVDDTVHFLSKYLYGRRQLGLTADDAVRLSFESTGPALLVTSIVLVLGFAMMAMSGYKPNYEVGQLTAIIIALAFLLDFLLLPALLLKFDADEATSTLATPMDYGATTAA